MAAGQRGQIDFGVNRCGIEAAMAQKIGDVFEWRAALHHTTGNRMS